MRLLVRLQSQCKFGAKLLVTGEIFKAELDELCIAPGHLHERSI